MRHVFALMLAVVCSSVAAVDNRPIVLTTVKGIFQCDVIDGQPGPWKPATIDLIVQGVPGGTIPNPPADPVPPTEDPVIKAVAAISIAPQINDVNEAMAIAAMVNSVGKIGLNDADFREAITTAARLADNMLKAEGRIKTWAEKALAITSDHTKLRAALVSAWRLDSPALETIHDAALQPATAQLNAEALNWAQIIEIIRLVLQLIRDFKIGQT